MVQKLLMDRLYEIGHIRMFIITIKSYNGDSYRFIILGGDKKAKEYAKNLNKEYDGIKMTIKEI